MERKWLVALVLVVAILVGCWFIPVYEGKNVYELIRERIEKVFKRERKEE